MRSAIKREHQPPVLLLMYKRHLELFYPASCERMDPSNGFPFRNRNAERPRNVVETELRSRQRRKHALEDLKGRVESLPPPILAALLSRVGLPSSPLRLRLVHAQIYAVSAQIVADYPDLLAQITRLQQDNANAQRQIVQLWEQVQQLNNPHRHF